MENEYAGYHVTVTAPDGEVLARIEVSSEEVYDIESDYVFDECRKHAARGVDMGDSVR